MMKVRDFQEAGARPDVVMNALGASNLPYILPVFYLSLYLS
jgi:hypothetical protein